jgi:hypothetical protein
MNDADEAIFQAITDVERIRSVTRKRKLRQVRGSEREVTRFCRMLCIAATETSFEKSGGVSAVGLEASLLMLLERS